MSSEPTHTDASPQEADTKQTGDGHDVEEFVISVVFNFAFPFIPLGLIFWNASTGDAQGVSPSKEILLFIAMFGLALCTSTRWVVLFALALLAAFVAAFAYGTQDKQIPLQYFYYYGGMLLLIHAVERYIRHAIRRESVLPWHRKSRT